MNFNFQYCILHFQLVLFYIFQLFVEVLTEFIHSSPNISEHPYAVCVNSLSGRLFISVSFSSFSEHLSCSFTWNIFLCLLILPFSVLMSMCQGDQLCLLILEKWPYVRDVL